jgi:hypothetical protein
MFGQLFSLPLPDPGRMEQAKEEILQRAKMNRANP